MNHHEPLVLEASLHSLSFSASPELRTTFLISLSTRTPNLVPRGPLGLGTKLGTYFDKKKAKVLAKGAWIIPGCSWSKPAARASSLGLVAKKTRGKPMVACSIMKEHETYERSKGQITSRIIKDTWSIAYLQVQHSFNHPSIPLPSAMPSIALPPSALGTGPVNAWPTSQTSQSLEIPWCPEGPQEVTRGELKPCHPLKKITSHLRQQLWVMTGIGMVHLDQWQRLTHLTSSQWFCYDNSKSIVIPFSGGEVVGKVLIHHQPMD